MFNFLGIITDVMLNAKLAGVLDFIQNQETRSHVFNVVIILIILLILNVILKGLSKKLVKKIDTWDENDDTAREKRAKTLVRVVKHTITIIVLVIGALMIFREVGLNITPLLTGAGVFGLAVGFGAQSVIKDFFSGFFILLENQYREGDVIDVAGKAGSVEQITLRITKLRDIHGTLHFIPNGEIKTVSNMSFLWSQAVVEVGVSYDNDVAEVFKVMNSVAEDLFNDKEFNQGRILEQPTVTGIESFGDSSLGFRMYIKVKPKEQWGIAREARNRMKKAFDDAGIEIPYPHLVIQNQK